MFSLMRLFDVIMLWSIIDGLKGLGYYVDKKLPTEFQDTGGSQNIRNKSQRHLGMAPFYSDVSKEKVVQHFDNDIYQHS